MKVPLGNFGKNTNFITQLKKRILILEQNLTELRDIEFIVKKMGFDVIAKPDAIAVAEIEHLSPNLIILEHLLPAKPGGELCLEIKRNQKTRHLSVIMSSAITNLSTVASDSCADGYLMKPINSRYAEKLIARHIR